MTFIYPRPFPIIQVKLGFYAPSNSRLTPKNMIKLCSIIKITLLWFQKMLCFISSNTCKLDIGHHVWFSHQLNKVKSASLLVCKTSDTAKAPELSLKGLVYDLRQNFLLRSCKVRELRWRGTGRRHLV